MLNQAVLVGRIVREPELRDTAHGKVSNITLAVPRSFKNIETGAYDTDFVDCILWKGVAESTVEYCKKGDLVGIKGRIQSNQREDENGKISPHIQIVAEKVTFLSSRKAERDENDIER